MGLPAARIYDAVAHPAAGVIVEGSPNVFISAVGRGAARKGDLVEHDDGLEVITEGEPTVRINGKPAARITDEVTCGGRISTGFPRVRIGHATGRVVGNVQAGQKMCLAAKKGRKSGKTQQSYENCGVESVRQLINQATGSNLTETQLLQHALNTPFGNGYEAGRGKPPDTSKGDPPVPLGTAPRPQDGGTNPYTRQAILNDYGVPSTVEDNNLDNISTALSNGQGVTADVDSGILWGDTTKPSNTFDHEVTVTGIEYDDNGQISNVIINDTGTGQCSQHVPIDLWNKATKDVPIPGTNPVQYRKGAKINVTDSPIF